MSTHATIFTTHEDSVIGIYVHFDGYEDALGKTLEENYVDYDDVVQLIEQGDASYIGATIEDSEFYANRGEVLQIWESDSIEDFVNEHGHSYNYFFNPEDEEWELL